MENKHIVSRALSCERRRKAKRSSTRTTNLADIAQALRELRGITEELTVELEAVQEQFEAYASDQGMETANKPHCAAWKLVESSHSEENGRKIVRQVYAPSV